MADLEKAKLYLVEGPLNKPLADTIKTAKSGDPVLEVQFNPSSLKVSLANSLKENERDQQTRASQFIEKSSSSLTVELIFDTSDSYVTDDPTFIPDPKNKDKRPDKVEMQDKDVRLLVKKIATKFMQSSKVGDKKAAPQRCLFAWGAFAFVGIMESLEETLDFFAPEGIPLRASVSLKMTESRFQFVNQDAKAAERDTPKFDAAAESAPQANKDNGRGEEDWRDTAMYNGNESPRDPPAGGMSVPTASASADLKAQASLSAGAGIKGGFSAGLGAGFSAGAGISGGLSAGLGGGLSAGAGLSAGLSGGVSGGLSGGLSGGINAGATGGLSGGFGVSGGLSAGMSGGLSTKLDVTPPSFSFGSSASLGTSIPGAFSADFKKGGGLSAGSLITGSTSLSGENKPAFTASASASASASSTGGLSSKASASASSSVGFD